MTKVLVTGATGNVGRHVVAALALRGAGVRAFVRDAGEAKEVLDADVELAVGDFEDPASLRRALQGIDRVFLTAADGPGKVAHEQAVIDAAAAAWVQRIVKLSGLWGEIGSKLAFADWHGRIEQRLYACEVPAVVLRANFFMSNLLASASVVRATGQLFAPAADARIAMVDPRDIAATAAVLLTEDGHVGTELTVTGPEAITYHDIAAHLSAATSREVRFVDVPDAAARAALRDEGAPAWLADNLVRLFALLRQGAGAEVTDTVHTLTGRPPTTFATWAQAHAPAFT